MVEDITWVFFSGTEHTWMLTIYNGTLLMLQDKYKGRVQMPSVTSLEIRNLSPQNSGQYTAQCWLVTGEDLHQVFDLKVCEPVSPPQILAKSLSVTAGWCNATLECRPTGATENLNVTWESKGLPRELEQRGTPVPAPTPWTQAASLPLSQANGSLTCLVSNPADQNRATSDLSDICPRDCIFGSFMRRGRRWCWNNAGWISLLGSEISPLSHWPRAPFGLHFLLPGSGSCRGDSGCNHDDLRFMVGGSITGFPGTKSISILSMTLVQDCSRTNRSALMSSYRQIIIWKPHEENDKRIGEQHPEARGPLTSVYSKLVLHACLQR
ncbi:uncharacterized protein LOC101725057 isoform X2 [Heterocephalus glaber]|uniref:Uncharacterized protein LOC101725057 isoform X2 n=1 Tax=Heterocephalus glaber TaxID=10181 RepID=A0AAX6SBX9_HETGA|nr:uncharacterized protein LOC101725057 isoform X2 [Heterocephalus glaber]